MRDKFSDFLRLLLFVLVVLFLFPHFYLSFSRSVHWDEFYYLSRIYELKRGGVDNLFQTLHVYPFYWLTWIPGGELAQVGAGRLVMGLLLSVSTYLLYGISRQFFSNQASLVVALSFLGLSETIEYGSQFRTDPILTFFLLLLMRGFLLGNLRVFQLSAAGIMLGISFGISLKSVLMLPSLMVTAVSKISFRRAVFAIAVFIFSAGLFLAVYFSMHKMMVEPALIKIAAPPPLEILKDLFLSKKSFSGFQYLIRSLALNPFFWAYLLIGLMLYRGHSRGILCALVLPLFYLLAYRNAYPYFYPFVLCLPALFVGALFEKVLLDCRTSKRFFHRALLLVFLVPLVLLSGSRFLALFESDMGSQRRLLSLVKRVFPEDTSYFDRAAMVSSYRKVNPFMSNWILERYQRNGEPIMKRIIAAARPQFLLANHPAFVRVFSGEVHGQWFFPEDVKVLREYFEHCSGPLYIVRDRGSKLGNLCVCDKSVWGEDLYREHED